jgi:hypothetical protein
MERSIAVLDLDPTIAAVLIGVWITVGLILVALLLLMVRVGRLERRLGNERKP